MDLVWDAFFCAPTIRGQLGATLLQFSLWAYITNYDYGLMSLIERWVARQPWYPNVQENYRDDEAQKIYGFPDPGFNFVTFCQTVIHHGCGGLFMLAGMLTGQSWLWRHGMLVEVGGMDLLDFFRIAWCKLIDPTLSPTCMCLRSPTFMPLSIFHHMVGLCVGIPVNMFFSDIFKFQLFGLVILGAPAISLVPALYVKTWNAAEAPRLVKANQLWMFITFGVVQRTLYFYPAAFQCLMHVWRSEVSSLALMIPFGWALFSLSAFNVLVVGLLSHGTYKMLMANEDDEQKRILRRVSTMSLTVPDAGVHFSVSQGLTGLFIVSKMLAKAEAAKENVRRRSKSKEGLPSVPEQVGRDDKKEH